MSHRQRVRLCHPPRQAPDQAADAIKRSAFVSQPPPQPQPLPNNLRLLCKESERADHHVIAHLQGEYTATEILWPLTEILSPCRLNCRAEPIQVKFPCTLVVALHQQPSPPAASSHLLLELSLSSALPAAPRSMPPTDTIACSHHEECPACNHTAAAFISQPTNNNSQLSTSSSFFIPTSAPLFRPFGLET